MGQCWGLCNKSEGERNSIRDKGITEKNELVNNKFENTILIYSFIGFLLNNIVNFGTDYYGNRDAHWLYIYLFWVPPLFFSILTFILINKTKRKEIKLLIFIVMGVFIGFTTQPIIRLPSNVNLGIHVTIGIISGMIIYFNRFDSIEKIITNFSSPDHDTNIEKIKIIQNEIFFWLRIFYTITFWGIVASFSILAIIFSFFGREYELILRLTSIYLVSMFLYCFLGWACWILLPLMNQLERLHDVIEQETEE